MLIWHYRHKDDNPRNKASWKTLCCDSIRLETVPLRKIDLGKNYVEGFTFCETCVLIYLTNPELIYE